MEMENKAYSLNSVLNRLICLLLILMVYTNSNFSCLLLTFLLSAATVPLCNGCSHHSNLTHNVSWRCSSISSQASRCVLRNSFALCRAACLCHRAAPCTSWCSRPCTTSIRASCWSACCGSWTHSSSRSRKVDAPFEVVRQIIFIIIISIIIIIIIIIIYLLFIIYYYHHYHHYHYHYCYCWYCYYYYYYYYYTVLLLSLLFFFWLMFLLTSR